MGIKNKKDDEPLEIGTSNNEKGSFVETKIDTVTINVFFDGTGNNKENTYLRLEDEKNPYHQEILYLDKEIKKTTKALNYEKEIAAYSDFPLELNDPFNNSMESFQLLISSINKKEAELNKLLKKKADLVGRGSDNRDLIDNKSYDNEFTNIALLEMASIKDDKNISIYIEGAGTKRLETDKTMGLGFAQGQTGVHARVEEAVIRIQEEVGLLKPTPTKLILNIFGFSRGAFYARAFCKFVKIKGIPKNKTQINVDEGLDPFPSAKAIRIQVPLLFSHKDITIRLVGLYDTVSSYGQFSHYNDYGQVRMNIGEKYDDISHVVHLTAQDEFREHFPLTPVYTALNNGIALEISFPGAHSNIGGSYTDYFPEEHHYLSWGTPQLKIKNGFPGEINWEWWVKKGYYLDPTQLKLWENKNKIIPKDQTSSLNGVILGYRKVRCHYQYIHLNSMKYFAEELGKLKFEDENEEYIERQKWFKTQKTDKGHDKLGVLAKMDDQIQKTIKSLVKEKGKFKFPITNALKTEEEQQYFYNQYICNSLYPQPSPYGPNFKSTQPKKGLDPTEQFSRLAGVENEGSDKNQDEFGIPQRRIVKADKGLI